MNLDSLLQQYDNGSLSRRELLGALALLVSASPSAKASGDFAQAASKPIGAVKSMNHVTVFVPDVKKSVQFYQDLFGLPVLTPQDPGINLSTGSSFLGIYPAPAGATTGSINHICLGMESFDADAVLQQLKARGLTANIRLRGDTKELYFTDPDGIRVQLQDVKYIGGTGVLGDKKPA
jgi:catechol 2,3-dioxygenase-like lactoylglutathione lyase family enzyme